MTTVKAHVSNVRARVDSVRQGLEAARSQHGTIDTAYELAEHDRRVGGSLLAGAIAFRAFLWLLPAALLVVLGLGITASASSSSAGGVVAGSGLPAVVAGPVSESADSENRGRALTIAVALIGLWSASGALLKAVTAAHGLAWGDMGRSTRSKAKGTLLLIAVLFGLIAAAAAASALRARASGPGAWVTVGLVLMVGSLWWVVSGLLPHADAPAVALLPGAALLGVGLQVFHLVVVGYLSRKLASSSELYGEAGAVATLLLGLFLIGRLVVASAMLNAALWRRRLRRTAA